MSKLLILANGITVSISYVVLMAWLIPYVPRKRCLIVSIVLVGVCLLMGPYRSAFALVLILAGLLFYRFEHMCSIVWKRVVLCICKSVGAVAIVLFSYVPLSSLITSIYPPFVDSVLRDAILNPIVLGLSVFCSSTLRKFRVEIKPDAPTVLCTLFLFVLIFFYGVVVNGLHVQNIRAASIANLFVLGAAGIAFAGFAYCIYRTPILGRLSNAFVENRELQQRLIEFRHRYSKMLNSVVLFTDRNDMQGLKRFVHKHLLPRTAIPVGLQQISNVEDEALSALLYGVAREVDSGKPYAIKVQVLKKVQFPASLSRPVCSIANIYLENALHYLDKSGDGTLSITAFDVKGYVCIEIANTVDSGFSLSSLCVDSGAGRARGNGLRIANRTAEAHAQMAVRTVLRPPEGEPYQLAQQILIYEEAKHANSIKETPERIR